MRVCMCACVHVCVCMYMRVNACVYACMCRYMCRRACVMGAMCVSDNVDESTKQIQRKQTAPPITAQST